jgi:hypothetical protein
MAFGKPNKDAVRGEKHVLNEVLIALSAAGCIVWRNNTGVLKDSTGRPVKFGLCPGSSDVIGIAPNGSFLAVEVKSKTGRVSPKQQTFIDAVNRSGGIAGVARSSEEAVALISI